MSGKGIGEVFIDFSGCKGMGLELSVMEDPRVRKAEVLKAFGEISEEELQNVEDKVRKELMEDEQD